MIVLVQGIDGAANMRGIFLAVITRLSIRELNKENVHCVSCTLNLAVSNWDQNISQFTFYDCTTVL
jgi:hypothetical protein